MGAFLTQSYLGWRWTAWITLIMAASVGVMSLFLVPETSPARILQIRAKTVRYQTKNWALHAKADESRVDAKTIAFVYLMRPFAMLVQEPILLLITLYMSFVYGVSWLRVDPHNHKLMLLQMLYLFFEAVRRTRHTSSSRIVLSPMQMLKHYSSRWLSPRFGAGTLVSARFHSLHSWSVASLALPSAGCLPLRTSNDHMRSMV